MKISLLILSFMYSSYVNGQMPCDSGYKYMPTLETSGLVIKADTCLPDSVCNYFWNEYFKSGCLETSFAVMDMNGNGSLSYSRMHKWDDEIGCIETEEYMVMRKNKWVHISKSEYEKLSKKKK